MRPPQPPPGFPPPAATSLPPTLPWILPITLLILLFAATALAYHLATDDDTDASSPLLRSPHPDAQLDEELAYSTRSPVARGHPLRRRRRTKTKSRIQKIWAERTTHGSKDEGVELLPLTPREGEWEATGSTVSPAWWGEGAVGEWRRRRRPGYVRVLPEEAVESESEDGGSEDGRSVEGKTGFLKRVDGFVDRCVERLADYLEGEEGEGGLLFAVTEEERGDVGDGWG